eukprot:m.120063 g.120063  ORF g.120063 m.120063 type:complete len:424 (-) comp14344_c0_seq6:202-1473(-)
MLPLPTLFLRHGADLIQATCSSLKPGCKMNSSKAMEQVVPVCSSHFPPVHVIQNSRCKAGIQFRSSEGDVFGINENILAMCPTARHLVDGRRTAFRNTLGGNTFAIEGPHVILKKEGRILATLVEAMPNEVEVLLPEIKTKTLQRVIEYCKFCDSSEFSDTKLRKAWEDKFVKDNMDQTTLCELASAAYYLDIKELVHLTSRAIADQISGISPGFLGGMDEQIKDFFAHQSGAMVDPTRARLLKKLGQKKKTQTKSDSSSPNRPSSIGTNTNLQDDRSLDDLLSFIGEPQSSKKKSKVKKKKKGIPDARAQTPEAPSQLSETQENILENHKPSVNGKAPQHSHSLYQAGGAASKPTMNSNGESKAPTADFSLIGKRREAARAKLASTSADDIVWAESDEDMDTEIDMEVQDFRKRLAQVYPDG